MSSLAKDFINFLNEASGSPFVACQVVQKRLESAGYVRLKENEVWNLELHKKYYLVRDDSSLVAFRTNNANATSRIFITSSHLDSPFLKLKPNPDVFKNNLALVSCEVYGGGIWHTWIDRDLGISGRVILANGERHIVSIKEPLFRICGLAIHLDTERKYIIDKDKHLSAVCAEAASKNISAYNLLLNKIAVQLKVDVKDIISTDLCLCDCEPASFLSLNKYIVGQGIDNLNGVFTSLQGFFSSEQLNQNSQQIDMFVAFDNEEVGSTNRRGAQSVFLTNIINRVHSILFNNESIQSIYVAYSKSVVLSIDGAHASHPTVDVMEKNHPIRLNSGPVLKEHCGQRYMSDGLLRAMVVKAAGDIPTQTFVLKQSILGGSTIGPHVAATTGMTTIDLGNPMLSMHSIREMCGALDVDYMTQLIERSYISFPAIIF
ncbi:hypothetical protein ENUP19_0039G0020 [Entamoeba nuttalli]|uniref:aspartyl aminopeptidase n=2 Tax=Entamoeba nuttalli TaxID=412467 RepID=K2GU27_ENTNP|nr:aspartyl aminopeptidase, putative [Entamoeba nuttalli P19]EKE37342.1 aspartyl aminopeptidase, putative [Entamoeba nuttalli P19]|eukprot:XP_008860325.1 aspartyl aminopeptidase, putative [Entamoeba nuttalli P19]